jgi:hypothetical protein
VFVIETCTDDCDVKINASETTIPQIIDIFGLSSSESIREWALIGDSLVDVPSILGMS